MFSDVTYRVTNIEDMLYYRRAEKLRDLSDATMNKNHRFVLFLVDRIHNGSILAKNCFLYHCLHQHYNGKSNI